MKEIRSADKGKAIQNNTEGKTSSYFYISLFTLFAVTFAYFLFFGSYVFSYQDNQILFVYSGSYLSQFLNKPGGLLEYAGAFLSQAFFSPVAGSFIISIVVFLITLVYYKICVKIIGKRPMAVIMMLVPSACVILFHSDYNFWLYNSLGVLFAGAAFISVLRSERKIYHIITVASFPLLFYLAGGYAWIFAGMYIFHCISDKNFFYPAILLAVAFVTLFLFKSVVFLQPFIHLIYYPLPLPALFKNPAIIYGFLGLLILFPVLVKGLNRIHDSDFESSMPLYGVFALISLLIFILSRLYNPGTADLFRLERFFYSQDWDGVIKTQEKTRSKSLSAQYYYNTALSEKGLLCSRLFHGPQNYGTKSLMIPWDSKSDINMIYRGAYFFYAVGLVNEAHRWAFESMVVQGYKPPNISLLIKTELIRGNYAVARKYINVLKQTLRYREQAHHYEKMLDHPDLVKSDPELGKKIGLMPKKDFMLRLKDQQDNVLLMLQSNPSNRVAYEYMIAWFMLERNLDKVAEEIAGMKSLGYAKIPDHIEEAALYIAAVTGSSSVSDSLKISKSTLQRFEQYQDQPGVLTGLSGKNSPVFDKNFGKTFWYYLDFKND